MQPVSAKWASALTTAHGISTKVNLLYGGSLVAEDISISDGSITVDRGSETRRSLSLTIPDPSVFPVGPTDPYAAYGQRVYVESGIRYMDGSTERVPVGTFLTTSITGNIHTGPLTLTAVGLEALLRNAVLETATSTTGKTGRQFVGDLIDTVDSAIGFVDTSTHGTDSLGTRTWDAGTTLWAAASDVATAIGAELYVDANGSFLMRDVPALSTLTPTADWTVDAGATGVMVSASLGLSSDDVYNRVIVVSENTADDSPPVQGTATITSTSDPLYYGGPFGKRVYRVSSPLAASTGQATVMATALLETLRAPNRTVSLEAIPNAALDAGDWLRVVPLSRVAPPELHLVQSFSLPLTASTGSFSISTIGGRTDA